MKTKITSIRLYETDINKIKSKINNTSKFLRYVENRYIFKMLKNSKDLISDYEHYKANYDLSKTKTLTYNSSFKNQYVSRTFLTAFIHYHLNDLLKNFKEM